jgi:hypothetical protein
MMGGYLSAQIGDPSMIFLNEDKGVVYNNEMFVELKVKTNGIGVGAGFGRIKTFYKSNLTYFSLENIKSNKEIRQDKKSANFPSTPYSYGKINTFYVIDAGKSIKYFWSDKDKYKGVLVGYKLGIGVSLGILQPYYLKVKYALPDDNRLYFKEIKYSPETAAEFLDQDNIIGKSKIFKGITESRLIPGVHGIAALHVDFNKSDEFITACELGTKIHLFTNPVSLMAYQKASPLVLDLFLSLQFGKRK